MLSAKSPSLAMLDHAAPRHPYAGIIHKLMRTLKAATPIWMSGPSSLVTCAGKRISDEKVHCFQYRQQGEPAQGFRNVGVLVAEDVRHQGGAEQQSHGRKQ